MQRIILFGKSKRRTRTTRHLARAFKDCGHQVLWLNPARIRRRQRDRSEGWIVNRIEAFEPDIIFIYSKDIPLAVLKRYTGGGSKTVLYYEDMSPEIHPSLAELGRRVDFFLATNKGQLDDYRRAGIANPMYFTGACDRYDHRQRRAVLPVWKSDLAFIGKARADEPRVRLTQKLAATCRVKVYGKGWRPFGLSPAKRIITPRSYALVCAGAKIILGADITSEVEGYWSNRLWLTLGCGGFFLTAYVRGMETFFENEKHLVWYRSEQECLELVEKYLARPDDRRRIARQGYQLVHARHSFHHFADRVVSLCSGK